MRVSLDARLAGYPGIGRFIVGLWGGLLELGAELTVLWPSYAVTDWLGHHGPEPIGPTRPIWARPFRIAEQVAVPWALRRAGVSVHHSPHLTLPYLSRVPVVLTVHDLFPYRDPRNARSSAAAAYYRWFMPRAVRAAAVVVADSHYTANELQSVLEVPDERIRVVELGLDQAFWRRPPEEDIERTLVRLGVPRPYLLYVGTAKRHKNLATLIAAHGPDLPLLVLAGPTAEELHQFAPRAEGATNVRVLGRVPDPVLPALYSGAIAVALPSLYEAVGLTALEAMACGTPVVSSDGGGLPETVGDAGIMVPPADVSAWSETLRRVVAEPDLRQRAVEAGFARVRPRSWMSTAEQYLDVYRSVLT